ncbi:hypothetical protein H4R34_004195 [Dimargaris verticillata]|uniref:Hepatocellular carcinoma-associated antigen 59-domain-containing protein n=1 Tax=Dimargaris verticillata TaxID=2761393 RepID=A0A9W8AZF0_9FUNG|nr:hypothetical protein H4R34_004195 [Dimargaris verticillata]
MPSKKQRNYRKRPSGDDATSSASEPGPSSTTAAPVPEASPASNTLDPSTTADQRLALDDLLTLRRLRRKQAGVDVDTLSKGDRRSKKHKAHQQQQQQQQDTSNLKEDENADDEGTAKPTVLGTFTTQSNALDVDKHMMAYIEQEMKRRRREGQGNSSDEDGYEDANTKPLVASRNLHDELYQLPAHLQVESQPIKEGSALLSSALLSAIPEVDLGIESKLRNIESTEQAKRQVREGKIKVTHEMPQRSHRFMIVNRPNRQTTANDDFVYERFKKNWRR